MGIIFLLFLLVFSIGGAILFFNKGEKAQEIKGLLQKISTNLKDLVSNLTKLFLLLISLFNENKEEIKEEDKEQDQNPSSTDSDKNSEIPSIDFSTSETLKPKEELLDDEPQTNSQSDNDVSTSANPSTDSDKNSEIPSIDFSTSETLKPKEELLDDEKKGQDF